MPEHPNDNNPQKRPRGRPRKPRPENPPPKRPRGRPRKDSAPVGWSSNETICSCGSMCFRETVLNSDLKWDIIRRACDKCGEIFIYKRDFNPRIPLKPSTSVMLKQAQIVKDMAKQSRDEEEVDDDLDTF